MASRAGAGRADPPGGVSGAGSGRGVATGSGPCIRGGVCREPAPAVRRRRERGAVRGPGRSRGCPPAPPTAGAGGPVGASPGGGGREPGGFQGRAPAGCVRDRSRPCAPRLRPAGRSLRAYRGESGLRPCRHPGPLPRTGRADRASPRSGEAFGRTAAKAGSGRAVTPAPCPGPRAPIGCTPGRVSGSGKSGRRVSRAGAPGPLLRTGRAKSGVPPVGCPEREVRPSCVAGSEPAGRSRPLAPDRARQIGRTPGGVSGEGSGRGLRVGAWPGGIARAGAGRLESYGAGGSLSSRSGPGAASRTRRRRPWRPPRTGSPPPCPAGGPARRAPRRRGLPGSGAPGRPTPGSPR